MLLLLLLSLLATEVVPFAKHSTFGKKRNTLISSTQISASTQIVSSIDNEITSVAVLAARKAGKLILEGSGTISLTDGIESKIGSRDIVTVVDKKAQDVIKETILSAFPSHSFLGEEDISPGIEASKLALSKYKDVENLWIVDPIDGTTNFAHGMPLSGVIIAFASKGEILFGIIFDPFRDELFLAGKGLGAYLNGQRIKCCATAQLRDAVVATGSPPNLLALEACLRGTAQISSRVRTVRMLGSAAVMLSWVAVGRLTAYFEADLNAWDLAAGSLIIREAGGKVTDVWGDEYQLTTRNLVASNGIIHEELLRNLVDSQMWLIQ